MSTIFDAPNPFKVKQPLPSSGGLVEPQQSALEKVLAMLGSKGGQTLVNAAGAGLQAYGAGKEADANRAMSARQNAASMAQRQLENDQQHQLSQATAGAAASPLGAEQTFAQKQALAKAILGSARNFSVSAPDPAVAAATGKVSGGLQLPPGGLDPAMLEKLFGDGATQASIAARQKSVGQINPHAPMMDFSTMFGTSADGSENAFQTDVRTSNADELHRQDEESARQRAIIQAALDDDIRMEQQQQQKKGGSIWGKIGSGLLKAAPMALGIPGISSMISGAILGKK